MMETFGVLSAACTGTLVVIIVLTRFGNRFERLLGERIPRPRLPHLEYRLWLIALVLPTMMAFVSMVVIAVYAWWVFMLVPTFPVSRDPHSPFPQAFAFLAGGLAIFVLPLLAFGVYYDKRIRTDGPEPAAEAAEVKAFRVYLIAALSVLVVLVVVASILMAIA